MGNIKGTSMDEIRNVMKEAGREKETALLAMMTPEEKNAYENVLSVSWFDVGLLTEITYKTAAVLFPGDPEGMTKLGAHASRFSLGTVYKIFLRILSVQQVFKQSAKIWKTYHSKGRAAVEPVPGKPQEIHFVVYEYPDLPPRYLPVMSAYMRGTLEMAGARNIRISIQDKNPEAWTFHIAWA